MEPELFTNLFGDYQREILTRYPILSLETWPGLTAGPRKFLAAWTGKRQLPIGEFAWEEHA